MFGDHESRASSVFPSPSTLSIQSRRRPLSQPLPATLEFEAIFHPVVGATFNSSTPNCAILNFWPMSSDNLFSEPNIRILTQSEMGRYLLSMAGLKARIDSSDVYIVQSIIRGARGIDLYRAKGGGWHCITSCYPV